MLSLGWCITFRSFDFTFDGMLLYSFVLFFLFAGLTHFFAVDQYIRIIPFMPHPRLVVYLTGFLEILMAGLLLIDVSRVIISRITIFYLIAVFPANIYMALNSESAPGIPNEISWIRLPIQIIFIFWVYRIGQI